LIYENKNTHDLMVIPDEVYDGYKQWIENAFSWMREVRQAWKDQQLPIKNYRNNSKICKGCPVREACVEAGTGVIKIASLEELSETL